MSTNFLKENDFLPNLTQSKPPSKATGFFAELLQDNAVSLWRMLPDTLPTHQHAQDTLVALLGGKASCTLTKAEREELDQLVLHLVTAPQKPRKQPTVKKEASGRHSAPLPLYWWR